MFSKILFISLISTLFLYSVTIKPGRVTLDGNRDVVIKYAEGEVMNAKDWVAIYKKGSDSEVWSNVLNWNWVNKLKIVEPGGPFWILRKIQLPVGEYEARIFKNNSYTIADSYDFTVTTPDTYTTGIRFGINGRPGEIHTHFIDILIERGYLPNPEDWIGIYKAEDNNSWDNLISWRRARDIVDDYSWIIEEFPLNAGDYEVRYFLNNSFQTHYRLNYHVDSRDIPQREGTSLNIEPYINADGNYSVHINLQDDSKNTKNWVGFFKDGKKYIFKNLLNWTYNTLDEESGVIDLSLVPSSWKGKTIRAVLFENDTYNVITESNFTLP